MDSLSKSLLKKVKNTLWLIIYFPNILYFLYFYLKYLKNPQISEFPRIRSVAYRSNGKSLNLAHAIGKRKYKVLSTKFLGNSGLLNLSNQDFANARKSMHKLGFWIAPYPIEISKLESFRVAAIENLYRVKNIDSTPEKIEELASLWGQDMINLETQWVMEQKLTLDLAASPDIIRIAAEYLQAPPVLNYPESWFSFPVEKIQKGSAKNWHWDCDGIKWLKVFVYLNDVTLDNGPHAFVAGSHRNWKVNDKSTRVTEEQILNAYGEKAVQCFTAPRGTIIFEDTRGFHRGTPLISGHRLVLQLQFNFDGFSLGQSKINLPPKYIELLDKFPRMLDFLKMSNTK
jgi:hypothetical protein